MVCRCELSQICIIMQNQCFKLPNFNDEDIFEKLTLLYDDTLIFT